MPGPIKLVFDAEAIGAIAAEHQQIMFSHEGHVNLNTTLKFTPDMHCVYGATASDWMGHPIAVAGTIEGMLFQCSGFTAGSTIGVQVGIRRGASTIIMDELVDVTNSAGANVPTEYELGVGITTEQNDILVVKIVDASTPDATHVTNPVVVIEVV